jgi:UDP-glucuronate 4-epimerase
MKYEKILITGVAGFIGFHLARKLLEKGDSEIIGIDNLNDYYSVLLKNKRISILEGYGGFRFEKKDFSSWGDMLDLSKKYDFDLIIHLGAQAGVRHSLSDPWRYILYNDMGTLNIFELARKKNIDKVIYASSSSVYGGNEKIPYSEEDRTDSPISLYAATKKSNELLAHSYSHIYGINSIGLRFFTVYGEYGRPDMAFWKFTRNILLDEPIDVYNYGKMMRDFTYVDDITDGISACIDKDLEYEIFNLGNGNPVNLEHAIELIEKYTGKKAERNYMGMQPGDIERTWADISKAEKLLGYHPKTSIEIGLKRFVDWFKENWEWVKDIKVVG